MKIKYTTISITPPPRDAEILVIKPGVFGDTSAIKNFESNLYSEEDMVSLLDYDGFTKWAEL